MNGRGYLIVPFRELVIAGRARLLEWVVDDQGREWGIDHETETACLAPGRFPGSPR